MKRIIRLIVIISVLLMSMVIIPVVTANTVKAESGMLVTLILFFIVEPLASVTVGILSGADIKFFWFTPIFTALLFWMVACFVYQPAFPIVYSAIYFVLCTISMLVTKLVRIIILKNRNALK